jgi:hypothetical protein
MTPAQHRSKSLADLANLHFDVDPSHVIQRALEVERPNDRAGARGFNHLPADDSGGVFT